MEFPAGVRDVALRQTPRPLVSSTQLTSQRVTRALSSTVKLPEREADYSLALNDEVKNKWTYISTPRCAFMALARKNLHFFLIMWEMVKHNETIRNFEINCRGLFQSTVTEFTWRKLGRPRMSQTCQEVTRSKIKRHVSRIALSFCSIMLLEFITIVYTIHIRNHFELCKRPFQYSTSISETMYISRPSDY